MWINNSLIVVVAIAILLASFYIQFLVMAYIYPFKKEANIDLYNKIRALLMSLIVVIVNSILRIVVIYFTRL